MLQTLFRRSYLPLVGAVSCALFLAVPLAMAQNNAPESSIDPATGLAIGDNGQQGYCCDAYLAQQNGGLCVSDTVTLTQCELEDYNTGYSTKNSLNYTQVGRKTCDIDCGKRVHVVGCLQPSEGAYMCKTLISPQDCLNGGYAKYKDDNGAYYASESQCIAGANNQNYLDTVPAYAPGAALFDDCINWNGADPGEEVPEDENGDPFSSEEECRNALAITACSQRCMPPDDAEVTVACACGLSKNICTVTVKNPSTSYPISAKHVSMRLFDYNPCKDATEDECGTAPVSHYCAWVRNKKGQEQCVANADFITVMSSGLYNAEGALAPASVEAKRHEDGLGITFVGKVDGINHYMMNPLSQADRSNPLSTTPLLPAQPSMSPYDTLMIMSPGSTTSAGSPFGASVLNAQLTPEGTTLTEDDVAPGISSFVNFNIPRGGKFEVKVAIPAVADIASVFKGSLGAYLFSVSPDGNEGNNSAFDSVWYRDGCLATDVEEECLENAPSRQVTLSLAVAGNTDVHLKTQVPLECIKFPQNYTPGTTPSPVTVIGCYASPSQNGEPAPDIVTENDFLHRANIDCVVPQPKSLDDFQEVSISFPVDPAFKNDNPSIDCGETQKATFDLYRMENGVDTNDSPDEREVSYLPQYCSRCDTCALFKTAATCDPSTCSNFDTKTDCEKQDYCSWETSSGGVESCVNTTSGPLSYCKWKENADGSVSPACTPNVNLNDITQSVCPMSMACCDRKDDGSTFYFSWTSGTANATPLNANASWRNDGPAVNNCYALNGELANWWNGLPDQDLLQIPGATIQYDDIPANENLQYFRNWCEYSYTNPNESSAGSSSSAAVIGRNFYCSNLMYVDPAPKNPNSPCGVHSAKSQCESDKTNNCGWFKDWETGQDFCESVQSRFCPDFEGGTDQPLGGGSVYLAKAYVDVPPKIRGEMCAEACLNQQVGQCCTAQYTCDETPQVACTPGSFFFPMVRTADGELTSSCEKNLEKDADGIFHEIPGEGRAKASQDAGVYPCMPVAAGAAVGAAGQAVGGMN